MAREKFKYYAVRDGQKKVIYTDWRECAKDIYTSKGDYKPWVKYRGFYTKEEAEAFLEYRDLFLEKVQRDWKEEGISSLQVAFVFNNTTKYGSFAFDFFDSKREKQRCFCSFAPYGIYNYYVNIKDLCPMSILLGLYVAREKGAKKVNVYGNWKGSSWDFLVGERVKYPTKLQEVYYECLPELEKELSLKFVEEKTWSSSLENVAREAAENMQGNLAGKEEGFIKKLLELGGITV